MRLRLGERTKHKVGKFSSSSNNLQDGSSLLKLAVVIYLFNQAVVIFATIIYLYQIGALASFIPWLSQGMHIAVVPSPRAHQPAGRGDNAVPGGNYISDDSFRLHNFLSTRMSKHKNGKVPAIICTFANVF
ncbi:hypothetical protein F2Q70_00020074 [Brassica cretica]|uniref:Uncharacterized protein n=1 Tax=Brassica cretica TaxID=69181 RepID=A0A8S9GM11_BRACR|nr:hypothetical protein F2Q70_00020074 [Brassica cretica]